ncbi:MAG: hypothetical protein AAGK14_15280 [Verrucomicrobiota bacterium]
MSPTWSSRSAFNFWLLTFSAFTPFLSILAMPLYVIQSDFDPFLVFAPLGLLGLLGMLILGIDIIRINVSLMFKLVWVLVVLFLAPIGGVVYWFFCVLRDPPQS